MQLRSPSHPTRGIPTAVSSLATLLRIPKVRAMFIKSDGTKLLAPLITPASNQQYIQVIIIVFPYFSIDS
jgi:V-type H+-transporting ATPase subunit H